MAAGRWVFLLLGVLQLVGFTLVWLPGSTAVPANASPVAALVAADLILCGRTNSPEFGSVSLTENDRFGITRNPWDLGKTPGGSSGGSAAGLAAGYAPLATGTDGGGSIRIPAALCGLFGLKPSRGRISLAPIGETLAGAGAQLAVTISVRDSAALLAAPAALGWFGAWLSVSRHLALIEPS